MLNAAKCHVCLTMTKHGHDLAYGFSWLFMVFDFMKTGFHLSFFNSEIFGGTMGSEFKKSKIFQLLISCLTMKNHGHDPTWSFMVIHGI